MNASASRMLDVDVTNDVCLWGSWGQGGDFMEREVFVIRIFGRVMN